ncbi:type I restriction-modification system subunit M [Dyadobacter sp. BHUBP1]|uniref:type I restriction-modification system subunit M n=1 Tax=Dyadobacter sp. BHUBP1 TaxID=3424178 RepID=UPI003D344782
MTTRNLVQKIWSFCDTLRDDGLGYTDYLEQLTYLLFLKMADENRQKYDLPDICDWQQFVKLSGGELQDQYEKILILLGRSGGMLEKIFAGAQNKIHDSSKLKKLITLINEEDWSATGFDIKGEIYESLLQKNAESSGAGQYFTPRPVIQAIVECIRPQRFQTIADPSCGTGGFFLGALDFLTSQGNLSQEEMDFLRFKTFHGWEIERATARLCLMNLYLHGIGDLRKTPDIHVVDSLKAQIDQQFDLVLANPPFGKSSSDIPTNDEGQAKKDGFFLRKDFWITTGNKQLAFLQHIVSLLKSGGQAAVVLPDNVLFEGGAGETIRRQLLEQYNLHTILRLPTGIFYAHGVKANVLFFEKVKRKLSAKNHVWIYDYRTNIHHTLKKNPLRFQHLQEFVKVFSAQNMTKRRETWSEENPLGRWRKFAVVDILNSEKANLDLIWLPSEGSIDFGRLPEADDLVEDIIENIESALVNFRTLRDSLH